MVPVLGAHRCPLVAVESEGGSGVREVIALVQVSDDGRWMQEVTQSLYSYPSVVESIRIPSSPRIYVILHNPTPF